MSREISKHPNKESTIDSVTKTNEQMSNVIRMDTNTAATDLTPFYVSFKKNYLRVPASQCNWENKVYVVWYPIRTII